MTLRSAPANGATEWRARQQREGSKKVSYSAYRFNSKDYKIGSWRKTLYRLEYFPKLKTWRLMETRREVHSNKSLGGWWKQIVLADLGDLPEDEALTLAMATLHLLVTE